MKKGHEKWIWNKNIEDSESKALVKTKMVKNYLAKEDKKNQEYFIFKGTFLLHALKKIECLIRYFSFQKRDFKHYYQYYH